MVLEHCRATRAERRRCLPGDDVVPQPMGEITHAIAIDAPPAAVWPWLIQMGSGRAGWYAYDHIDNGGAPSARTILPEFQHMAAGDVMPWLPGAQDGFIVREAIPERALILVVPLRPAAEGSSVASRSSAPAPRASWALVLDPLAQGRTRLIARSRLSRDWLADQEAAPTSPGKPFVIERIYGLLAKLPGPLLLPVAGFGHYLMESRMLRGIKRRAEWLWAEERAHDRRGKDVPAAGVAGANESRGVYSCATPIAGPPSLIWPCGAAGALVEPSRSRKSGHA